MTIEEIYTDNVDRVYKFYYLKTFDHMLSEDLTSKTFMAMLDKMYDNDVVIKKYSVYLSGVMRNVWLRYLQEKYKKQVVLVEDIEDFNAYVTETTSLADTSDDLEKLAQQHISRLPTKQQDVLRMRLVKKMTLKEICTEIGKDMNYVRTTQKRGIAKLRDMLVEEDNITAIKAAQS